MGSAELDKKIPGTFKFAVDLPLLPYDPWQAPYGKAPDAIAASAVERTCLLTDCRNDVLDGTPTLARSKEFLRTHGFTAVKHRTALLSPPHGQPCNFENAQLVHDIYYAEVEELVKEVTGCSRVFITDSIVRGQPKDEPITDASWKGSITIKNVGSEKTTPSTQIHKPSPSPPVRIPHWDVSPLGARQIIRSGPGDVVEHARQAGVTQIEDEICAPFLATDKRTDSAIMERYNGPRYASFSIWRPRKKVTRDPLAMALYSSIGEDPDFVVCPHIIKQPGVNGDWLRELTSLRLTEKAAERSQLDNATSKLQWYYVSKLDVDEVLFVKSFDSAALPGQARVTGETPGGPHASPDIGDSAHGPVRESVEVRLITFW